MRKAAIFITAALGSFFLGPGGGFAQRATESWGWTYQTGGNVYSSPAVAGDGTIYVGSGDNKLYALESNGTLKWTFEEATDWIDSSPAVGSDGTVYVGSWDNNLYAIDPTNGTKKWGFETNSAITGSPAIGADGTIYFGSNDYFFYALDSNGSEKWSYYTGDEINSSPAIGADGTIYFGDDNGSLHALDENGVAKWSYEVPNVVAEANNTILSSPAIDLAGNVFFGCSNGFLYSIADNDTSASLNWSYEATDAIDSSPVFGPEGNLYFISRDSYLRAVDSATGIEYWTTAVGDVFYSTPVVDSQGNVYVAAYVGSGNNAIYVYESDGTMMTSKSMGVGGVVDSSLTLTDNGYLLFGCFDDKTYAVNMGNPMADSDWPKFKRNLAADGRWPSHYVDANASPSAGGSVSGGGTYNDGADATITATPATGYDFTSWSGDANGTNASHTFSSLIANKAVTANFTIRQYALSLTAGTGGTTSGDGTYDHGATATITATPDTGYHFTGWSSATVDDSTSTTTTIILTQAESITANFALNEYALVVVGGSGGSTTGDGNFTHGTSANIAASPDTGYHFVNWTGDGATDENASSTTVTMDQNRSVTANFAIDEHLLTVTSGDGGSASGSGVFDFGTSAGLTATPDVGYHFDSWSGSGVTDPTSASTTVSMTTDRNVSAVFVINSYTLTIATGSNGSVAGGGNYSHGTSVTITATADPNYHFVDWSGEGVVDTTAESTSVTMDQNRSVTANFAIDEHLLIVNAGTGGTVTGDGNYNHDTNTNINATPATGYHFDSWSGSGVADSTAASTTVSMTTDRNVTANFAIDQHVLTVNAGTGGNAIGDGTYDYDTNASINATPSTGYHFVSWTGSGVADSTAASTIVSMTADRNVSANFAIDEHLLTLTAGTGGTVTGDGNYTYDTNASITATPDVGRHFDSWTGSGVADSTSASTTVSMTSDRNVSAVFAIDQHVLTVNAGSGGNAIGSGTYNYDTNASINASPSTGFHFVNWTGATVADENDSSTTITITSDVNVSANFAIDEHLLTLAAGTGGTVTGNGNYTYDSNASITATPDLGHHFDSWSGAGVADSASASTTVSMTTDRNVSAVFAIDRQVLTVNAGSGGIAIGSGTYDYDSNASIIANPSTGYHFVNWTGAGVADENDSSTTITMTSDANVTANFEANVYPLIVNAGLNGNVSGDGNFSYGTNAEITATPNSGYYFTSWSGEGVIDANSSITTVSMTQDRNVTASFAQVSINKYVLGTFTDPLGSGSTGGGGVYDANESVALTATAGTGYQFLGWTATGGTLSSPLSETGATITLDQTSDANATAHFDAQVYELGLNASTGGSVSGEGNHTLGEGISITATPDSGYSFVNWEVNGTLDFAITAAPRQYDASVPALYVNGKENPPLTLARGNTYHFNLDGATSIGHPFYFSDDSSGGGNSSLGEYTTGVTNSQGESGTVSIIVDDSTPSVLYYYCGNHPGMGNVITIVDATGFVADPNASSTTVEANASCVLRASFSLNQQLLTVNAGTGGSVVGSGTFDYGTLASITATPQTGRIFSNWSGLGITDQSSSTTTVSMTEDRNVTANFEIGFYQVVVTAEPGEGGSVIGSGSFAHGDSTTIAATPDTGYVFSHWDGTGITDATASSTTVTVSSSQTITANFVIDEHFLTLTAGTGGAVSGEGNYTHEANASISATPDTGYHFVNWSGSGVADTTSLSTTVSMDRNRSVTAYFAIDQQVLNVTASSGGSAIGSGTYDYGANASITAAPGTGYHFVNWTGAEVEDENDSSTTITMTADHDLTANFAIDRHTLSITAGTGGAVSGEGTYDYDLNASITATPEVGYHFDSWTGAGVVDSGSATTMVAMTSDRNVSALFAIDQHTLILTAGTGGSVSGNGIFDYQTNAGISANPGVGYHFVNWTGAGVDDENKPETTINMTTDSNLTANFAIDRHVLTASAGFGGSVSGSGTFDYGTYADLNATPDTGHHFDYWSGSGTTDSSSANTTVSMTADLNLTAIFAINQYALTVNASSGGNAIGGGTYDYESNASITATPDTGYHFVNWTGEGVTDAASTTTTVAMEQNRTVSAHFELNQGLVTLDVDPSQGGTVSGAGPYEYSAAATLSATAAHGYVFSHWSGIYLTDYNASSLSMAITQDIALTAHFTPHSDAGELHYELNATEHEAGWKESGWFGFFHQVDDNWAYHFDFGWIYVGDVTEGGFWYWHDILGWLWTNDEIFPTARKSKDEETDKWIRFWQDDATGSLGKNDDGRLLYYDYSIDGWSAALPSYLLTSSPSPSNGGSVSGDGSYQEGTTATLVAKPAAGFEFTGWSGHASGSSSNLAITVNSDLSVTATFSRISVVEVPEEPEEPVETNVESVIGNIFGR